MCCACKRTKCPDDAFPMKRFKRLGYEHVALNGQKGYHGVAIVSKLPFESSDARSFCGKIDSRHISVEFGQKAELSEPLTVHNFYVPAGGDIPDPALNPKFDPKLSFLDEMRDCEPLHPKPADRHILVGDLNVAPHEPRRLVAQAASENRVAYADRVREAARRAGTRRVDRRCKATDSRAGKNLYLVELPLRRLGLQRTRAAASITSGCRRRSKIAFPISESPEMPEAGSVRRTMCR